MSSIAVFVFISADDILSCVECFFNGNMLLAKAFLQVPSGLELVEFHHTYNVRVTIAKDSVLT